MLSTTHGNVARQYNVTNDNDAIKAAIDHGQSRYAREIEEFFDDRKNRDLNIAMRTNRAVGF